MSAQFLQGFWHELGRQLRHPSGAKGRWIGHLMSMVNREPNRLAIAALHASSIDNILELGGGSGWALCRLAGSQCRGLICGVDQSAEMLKLASRSTRSAAAPVLLTQARFDALPFRNETFDRLLAVNIAYFFHPDGRDLREAHRVMRRGGRLAVYVSDRATLAKWPFAGEQTHRSYDADELACALRTGGFSAREIKVDPVKLPLGVSGLLATAEKNV
jgi:ubiquinone/menaquinone biosynthesis C-methylase UbiE